jgi:hypothetical protein
MAHQVQAKRVYTGTLDATNADLINMIAPGEAIIVTNNNGLAPIYFTVDTPGGACAVPTVGGANCYSNATAGQRVSVRHDGMYGSIVQLIAAASVQYTIEVGSRQVNV